MAIFESQSQQMIEFSIFKQRAENARERMALRKMLLDFYQEDQYAIEGYQRKYGFEDADLPPISTRLTKRVVNTLSMIYKRPPQRSLLNKQSQPIENDPFNKWLRDNPKYDMQLKKFERHHNLLGNLLFRFAYSEKYKRWYFYIETDYIPTFTEENQLYPVGYDIPMPEDVDGKGELKERWLFVSDDEMYFHDGKGKQWGIDGGDDLSNPYKIMPIIDMTDEDIDGYWVNGMRSLVEFHRHYNIAILNMFYGIHLQSFDQPWVRNFNPEAVSRDNTGKPMLRTGSAYVWDLGLDGEAGILGFSPKLVESLEVTRGLLNMELDSYGLQLNWKDGSNPASGIALKIDSMPLLEMRESEVDRWQLFEKQAYKIIATIERYHELGYNMPLDAEAKADFVEPEFPLEPAEERMQAEWEWKNNLSTPADWLRDRNPDLTEEEAQEQIRQNQQFNNVNGSRGVGLFNNILGRNGEQREQEQESNFT